MGEGQSFFLSLLFLNKELKINIPKNPFWGGKTLVRLNEKTWSQMVVPGHMAHVGGVVWGVLCKG